MQGGYVSQSGNKSLSVAKKSNILDKIPPKGPKGASSALSINANNVSSSSGGGGGISVSSKIAFSIKTMSNIIIEALVLCNKSQFTLW